MDYSSLSLKDLVCLLCTEPRDNEAWEEFVSRVDRPISLTIMRMASLWKKPSRSLVEDLRQDTYLKLWKGRRLLRDFAIWHSSAILGYIKVTAANATRDYFKGRPDQLHVSPDDVDVEAPKEGFGSPGKTEFEVFLKEIDEHFKRSLIGPDSARDRTIFWLYYRQGMSTKEIASLPTVGLTAKGVGSVIGRLAHCIRERILGIPPDSDDDWE